MATKSIAGAKRTAKGRESRELKGVRIALEHFEEIAASYKRGGVYTVPSERGGKSYTVVYSRRDERCECKDFEFGHVCKHLYAVAVVAAKTGVCAGCGKRFRHRDLFDVSDSLTFYEGDRICGRCADRTASEVI